MLIQRTDVDTIEPLVGVVELCDDPFFKLCHADIRRDALCVLVPISIEGLDLVGRSKLFASSC